MKGTKAFRFAMLAALVAVTLPWSAFAEPVDICGRTGVIREAILSALTVPPDDPFNGCAMVDSDALAAIERLQVQSHAAVPTLLKGDFDGLSGLRYLDMSETRFATLPVGAFDGLTLYELELHIYRLPAGVFDGLAFEGWTSELDLSVEQKTLPVGVFDGLTLGRLDLGDNYRNQLVSLPAGVFDGLSVNEINLSSNQLQDLPKGVFDGLTLTELDLSDNQLTTIDAGTFEGLAFLSNSGSHLFLNRNRLRTIQDGAFDGMEVAFLGIWRNRTPMTIEAGAFDGLTVTGMLLADSKIERIDAGAFDGLTFHADPIRGGQFDYTQHDLILSENRLTTLPRGLFHGVTGDLRRVLLNDNELTTLPAGAFDGLPNVGTLDLKNNELSALPAGLFRGVELGHLNLSENDLTALPVGVFRGIFPSDRGLDSNTRLDLGGNSLTTIQADTFNGTIVETLVLDGNPLTTLGPGAFRGLVAAEVLIWGSLLETIHPGAFEGFGPTDVFESGYKLSINNAPLATIHPGAFRGAEVSILELFHLPLLTTLRSGTFDGLTVQNIQIRDTALRDIEKGAFRGLQVATRFPFLFLGLIDNELTTIKPDMFDGLTETLGVLDLVGNRLSAIVAGSFDDLFLPSHCPATCRLFLDGNHLVGLTRDDPLFANLQPTNDIGLERQKPHLRGGICDRSDVVIEAITSLHKCADINSEQLAAVTSLNLGADALKAGDLDGFTNLRELSLGLGGTVALPAGVFDDLESLTVLNLAGRGVMMPLPVGVFDSLTFLTTLGFGLPVFTLPDGVFDKLTALTRLSVRSPNLTTLPDRVFDNLTSVENLTLFASSLTTLPEGAFAKLTSLERVIAPLSCRTSWIWDLEVSTQPFPYSAAISMVCPS